MTREFLNYSVARSTDAHSENRYVVTAEYSNGYSLLSFHKTKADADAAVKRYQAADRRRAS
jgi:hypothetical protein